MENIDSTNKKPVIIDRQYQKASKACSFECEYCFAKWRCGLLPTADIHGSHTIVLYPLCDSELFAQDKNYLENFILDYIKNKLGDKRLIVSISTKDRDFLVHIPVFNKINEILNATGGFVKLGVSFSSISKKIEKGTASFEERINILKTLAAHNFKLSSVIKPILPFISVDEYKEIVKSSSPFVDKYLLGGLYVEEDSEFFKSHIKGKYGTVQRPAAWLNNEEYPYIGSEEMQSEIAQFITSIGKNFYSSDIDLIESWI